jgi:hypothetical protein
MLRSIGLLIRARQEERVIQTSEAPAVMFNIVKDVRYRKVIVAANQACTRSAKARLGRETLQRRRLCLLPRLLLLIRHLD